MMKLLDAESIKTNDNIFGAWAKTVDLRPLKKNCKRKKKMKSIGCLALERKQ